MPESTVYTEVEFLNWRVEGLKGEDDGHMVCDMVYQVGLTLGESGKGDSKKKQENQQKLLTPAVTVAQSAVGTVWFPNPLGIEKSGEKASHKETFKLQLLPKLGGYNGVQLYHAQGVPFTAKLFSQPLNPRYPASTDPATNTVDIAELNNSMCATGASSIVKPVVSTAFQFQSLGKGVSIAVDVHFIQGAGVGSVFGSSPAPRQKIYQRASGDGGGDSTPLSGGSSFDISENGEAGLRGTSPQGYFQGQAGVKRSSHHHSRTVSNQSSNCPFDTDQEYEYTPRCGVNASGTMSSFEVDAL